MTAAHALKTQASDRTCSKDRPHAAHIRTCKNKATEKHMLQQRPTHILTCRKHATLEGIIRSHMHSDNKKLSDSNITWDKQTTPADKLTPCRTATHDSNTCMHGPLTHSHMHKVQQKNHMDKQTNTCFDSLHKHHSATHTLHMQQSSHGPPDSSCSSKADHKQLISDTTWTASFRTAHIQLAHAEHKHHSNHIHSHDAKAFGHSSHDTHTCTSAAKDSHA
ncbi:hypothetical protein I3842_09G134000 [Carya illinoinensis]|uniref:Uncharacterized protein n=1 Tax=Carya illinoinensis TaxID=32201 RepID=A0A922E5I1_CARIL|nr:hypothetical protein I3842_09G134000 [Carya illinoinensis]